MLRALRLREILLGGDDAQLSKSCPDLLDCFEQPRRKKKQLSKATKPGRISVLLLNCRPDLVEDKDTSSLDFVPWLQQRNKLSGSMEQVSSFPLIHQYLDIVIIIIIPFTRKCIYSVTEVILSGQ